MEFPSPPKLLNWKPQLSQEYTCDQSLLITSGCSFTASTLQLESAASWPGYVKDRCGFDKCIDMSYPGVGNLYIKDSIINTLEQCHRPEDALVIVMWSGLNRAESLIPNSKQDPAINDISYQRCESTVDVDSLVDTSINYILELEKYLTNKNISYAFTSYVNLLHPPFIPVADKTPRFTDNQNHDKLQKIREAIHFPAKGSDYLYDWAFLNHYLDSGDDFHPPVEANLKWTDTVLLPNLKQLGIIE